MAVEELKHALESLNEAIANADGPQVASSLAVIDEVYAAHGRELDPQLKHYLRNRSYQKALMFLGAESDIPKGRCAGRNDFS